LAWRQCRAACSGGRHTIQLVLRGAVHVRVEMRVGGICVLGGALGRERTCARAAPTSNPHTLAACQNTRHWGHKTHAVGCAQLFSRCVLSASALLAAELTRAMCSWLLLLKW
jgi:hypothetical protein